jgi:hypothetical protein
VSEHDVFRLQIGVRQLVFVHEVDGLENLLRERLHQTHVVAALLVLFEEIVEGGPEGLEYHEVVVLVVEGFVELGYVLSRPLILLLDLVQNLRLNLRRGDVLFNGSYDLHGVVVIVLEVFNLENPSKGPVT